jgi:hypothetical protein
MIIEVASLLLSSLTKNGSDSRSVCDRISDFESQLIPKIHHLNSLLQSSNIESDNTHMATQENQIGCEVNQLYSEEPIQNQKRSDKINDMSLSDLKIDAQNNFLAFDVTHPSFECDSALSNVYFTILCKMKQGVTLMAIQSISNRKISNFFEIFNEKRKNLFNLTNSTVIEV